MKNIYVDVVLARGGRYATLELVKKTDKPFRFIGGKPEDGEPLMAAAARELEEETGTVAESLRFIDIRSSLVDGKIWTGYYFVCDQWNTEPTVQEPDKHKAIHWFTSAELVKRDAYPECFVAENIERFRLANPPDITRYKLP